MKGITDGTDGGMAAEDGRFFLEWNKVSFVMWIDERDHGWSGWRDGRGGWVIFSRVE